MSDPIKHVFRLVLAAVGTVSSIICFYFVAINLLRAQVAHGSPSEPRTDIAKMNGESCYKSSSWCIKPDNKIASLTNLPASASANWGSFRPGSYIGMKAKTSGPAIATGVMWSSSLSNGKSFRDQAQSDELTQFEWIRHDGQNFGVQRLIDDAYGMHINSSFIVPDASRDLGPQLRLGKLPTWFQKLDVDTTPRSSSSSGSSSSSSRDISKSPGADVSTDIASDKKSLVFYFGVECASANPTECVNSADVKDIKIINHKGSASRGYDQAISVAGYSDYLGWFCLFFMAQDASAAAAAGGAGATGSTMSLSYAGMRGADILGGVDRLKQNAKMYAFGGSGSSSSSGSKGRHSSKKDQEVRLYDEFGDLSNHLDTQSSFVALQLSFMDSVRVDALLFDHLSVSGAKDLQKLIEEAEASSTANNVLPFTVSTALSATAAAAEVTAGELTNLQLPYESASEEIVTMEGAAAGNSVARTSSAMDQLRNKELFDPNAGAAGGGESDCGIGDCIRLDVDNLATKYSSLFEEKFASVFLNGVVDGSSSSLWKTTMKKGESGQGERGSTAGGTAAAELDPALLDEYLFTPEEAEAAKVCLSSVLGGMGHFHGWPAVGGAADVDADAEKGVTRRQQGAGPLSTALRERAPPVSLFTATPSRSVFPRGFLWDEGFHQMLISQWQPALSIQVIGSWLEAMHFPCDSDEKEEEGREEEDGVCVGGWIPREMILGEDARRRVPDEFVVQRVNIANPPTFLLVIESLLKRFAAAKSTGCYGKDGKTSTSSSSSLYEEQHNDSNNGTTSNSVSTDTSVGQVNTDSNTGAGGQQRQLVPSPGAVACSESAVVQYQADRAMVVAFVRDAYPLLHQWMQWFLHTQRGADKHPGSFRWRGRSASDGKVLPNTLASGLDDYPRSAVPTRDEHHVDLHSWMTKATGVMALVETTLSEQGYPLSVEAAALAAQAKYAEQHAFLLKRLEELHWSAKHRGYFDVGIHSDDSHFQQELTFRCGVDTTSTPSKARSTMDVAVPLEVLRSRRTDFCPASHPQPLHALGDGRGGYHVVERFVQESPPSLTHIPRVGYVALFPLMMKLVDPFSSNLGAMLDMLEDPEKLWTEFGIRSIAKSDMFYQKRNSAGDAPYWRGPIWIPVNYLILGGLHHYAQLDGSTYQARVQTLYTKLRHNLLRTVFGGYLRTGFFWEQYEDDTGNGMRGHPFTGWTSIIVNIMSERY